MGVSIPSHFYICMAEAAGNFLYVYALVGQQRGVGMPEVVDTDFLHACQLGIFLVAVFYSAIAQGFTISANKFILAEIGVLLAAFFVLLQNIYKRFWHLQCA